MTSDIPLCPYCGKPLEKGTLCYSKDCYIAPEGADLGSFYSHKGAMKKGAICLSRIPGNYINAYQPPTVWFCRPCRRAVIPFDDYLPRE